MTEKTGLTPNKFCLSKKRRLAMCISGPTALWSEIATCYRYMVKFHHSLHLQEPTDITVRS